MLYRDSENVHFLFFIVLGTGAETLLYTGEFYGIIIIFFTCTKPPACSR